MTPGSYCAVYDFELMPYALGDVLTWNVQTAIRCEELGRANVDVFICLDPRFPSSIYQRGLVTAANCGLFFNELFGAFGTHPALGNVFIYRRREELLDRLTALAQEDAVNTEVLTDYERALASRTDEKALIEYFTKYIYFHERINAFARQHARIPLLQPSIGCGPDVAGLVGKLFAGKRIVVVHPRLRRLDAGYGGEHTYARDSDFLEWFEFLRDARAAYPDVQFVVMGRLQEKPLELLRMPNVISLRTLGLGLGHELTLMLYSDLFIGTSSGFAAMANFSQVPYFITKMNRESCNAYQIEQGAQRLPFATERQVLVYEAETRDLLMDLLARGLSAGPRRTEGVAPQLDPAIDVRSWEWERSRWLHPGATTSRFFTDDTYCDKETAFLLWPRIKEARADQQKDKPDCAGAVLNRVETSFPRLSAKFPELQRLRSDLAPDRDEAAAMPRPCASLAASSVQQLRRYAQRTFPAVLRLRRIWQRKHRIPAKLLQLLRRMVSARRSL